MSSATTIPSTAHHNTIPAQLSPASNCSKATKSSASPPSKASEFDITKDEFERISEALKKEEFRKLFLDYIEEIQDPENRKRYEEEIKQIEAERGVDVIFVHPQPGFVIKTSQNGEQKCFINCAKSEHVGKPTNQVSLNHATGQRGLSWSIPMAQAPPRDDFDNNKKRCCVYDVVFHPDALYLAEKNSAFHKCLVDTALDAVEREYKVTLDRVNIKFPKLQYKGLPRPTVIRKLSKNPYKDAEEPHPLEHMYPAKPSAESEKPKILPLKTMETIKKSEYCTPKYTLTHRHDVDLSQYTNELDAKLNATKPRELVVDIELPLLNSSNECQLDVTEKSIFLLSDRAGAKYRLNLDLPLRVDEKNGTAKFDVDTRHLVITLPVVQPSLAKQKEMHEALLHLNREDSGVESDMLNEDLLSSSSNTDSPVEELNTSSLDEVLKKAVNNVDTSLQSFLKANVDYQIPNKFDCNVLDNTMSLILQVRNVQEDSIQMQRQERSLHVQFSSVGTGYYPTYYAFYIHLPESKNDIHITGVEAEAWENNVILNLQLSETAENLTSYLAGLDSEHLKEYSIYGKTKIAHKSRQRQKVSKSPTTTQSNLDITIERSECDKSVDIEIKPHLAENSTCNANTTEDEDTHSGTTGNGENSLTQSSSKKVNKKQKRKNKKRRSLSESACDDIKAYQQQQEQDQQQQHQLQDQQQKQEKLSSTTIINHEADADADDDDDEDDEDSSPERCEKSTKPPNHPISSSMNVPSNTSSNVNNSNSMGQQQRNKQRSFSESRDSVISLSAGSCSYKGILKHYSRYGPRPSLTDSCSSIDECSSSAYSTSVDGMTNAFNALRFSQSFSDIPEENVVGLSESCKKTVRFSEVIRKQVFRLDSSILGQRKKNQKRRDRKQKALQRRLSEGDSADYEDNKPMAPLPTSNSSAQYLKTKNNSTVAVAAVTANNKNGSNKNKDKKSNQKNNRPRLESESSSDVDNHKNAMMFEMDM
ncbi:PIH1 domain-containing protein Nop17-like [Musca autumnalis]|uniref:PIH1 domain-containing protein Nop17-like n=1 Tax=Musca autumnalis TaxID=221902 RepID=UPI003CF86F64